MVKYKSDTPRIRLFRNDLLERLSLVSPLAFALVWAAYLALELWAGWGVATVPRACGLVAAGLLVWILFEYAMHRFVFHLKLRSALGRTFVFLAHGNHHAAPGDRHRNLMPPMVSVTITCAVWGIFWLVAGPKSALLVLGFSIGYVCYDAVHYACHQMPMRSPLLRALRRHHIRHHHARVEGNYAITAIFLDRLFGTDIPAKGR